MYAGILSIPLLLTCFFLLMGEEGAEGVRGVRGFRVWIIGWGGSVLLLFGGGGCLLNRPGGPACCGGLVEFWV